MKTSWVAWILAAIVLQLPYDAAEARNCAGDCDRDDVVAIHELLTGVGQALGAPAGTASLPMDLGAEPAFIGPTHQHSAGMGLGASIPTARCPQFDTNLDSQVSIDELVYAVNNALDGCDTTDFCGDLRAGAEKRIDELLEQMTLAEKVEQMHGRTLANGLWVSAANERLGIPPFRMTDGPRGVGDLTGNATAFPVAVARGATWDPALERRVGEAIGRETRAKGGNVLLAPTINILRHPRWGRAQETYGEDPLHLGRMGVGFILGAQRYVIASVKHLAANSIEDTRFDVNVTLDERTLREMYLPHFRMAVQDGHVGSVMSAYNKVNGLYCAENPPLLAEALKGDWAFEGFVESDWVFGTHSTVESALAGLDIEMPAPRFYGEPLVAAVEDGQVPEAVVDQAVRRILRVKLCFSLDTDPSVPDPDAIETPSHTNLTLEAERKAIVLLENRAAALPLDRSGIDSLVVAGPLADVENIGDRGSSSVDPSFVVTPLEGIRNRAGSVEVTHVSGNPLGAEERSVVAAADAVVIVVGLTFEDEGEGLTGAGDREMLDLSPDQEQLIAEIAGLSDRVIVVLEGGSAITVESWVDDVDALLMSWYPGQEGGHAIADVLFGEVNPSGKLPITVPRSEDDLPPFNNDELEVEYGYLHGYRLLDRQQTTPRYPFGFGRSYTTFAYENIAVSGDTIPPDGMVSVSLDVINTGSRAGTEIVQLYVGYDGSTVDRPVRDLRGFERVSLAPGERRRVSIELQARDLAYYDTAAKTWIVEPITYLVRAGSSSRDLPLGTQFRVTP